MLGRGEALDFTSPAGAKIVVARQGEGDDRGGFSGAVERLPAPRLPRSLGSAERSVFLSVPQRRVRPQRQPDCRPTQSGESVARSFSIESGKRLAVSGSAVNRSLCPRDPANWHVHPQRRSPISQRRSRLTWDGLLTWLHERVPISAEQLAELTNEPVPNHLKRWWFCLGGTPAYLFVVQIVTGILLAIYYQPSPSTAYESIRYITDEATFGWYFRSLHKWAATLMIAAVILHQMRVYFTGAYRRPRELNWMIGMCLLLCTLLTGFTGYSLVFEQLSYWGATVAANISDAVPVVGTTAKQMLLGGDEYNDQTLSRFYILHAAILPTTIVLLVIVHIALIRMHGVTEFRDPGRATRAARGTSISFPTTC